MAATDQALKGRNRIRDATDCFALSGLWSILVLGPRAALALCPGLICLAPSERVTNVTVDCIIPAIAPPAPRPHQASSPPPGVSEPARCSHLRDNGASPRPSRGQSNCCEPMVRRQAP